MLGRIAIVVACLASFGVAQYTLQRANPSPLVSELIAWEPNTGEAFSITPGSSTLHRFEAGHWLAATTMNPAPPVWNAAVCTWPGQGILLVGDGQTWLCDGTAWTQFPTTLAPVFARAVAFDEVRGVAVAVASASLPSGAVETWEFDGLHWTQPVPPNPAGPPFALPYMQMAWDPQSQRCLLAQRIPPQPTAMLSWNGLAWTWHAPGAGSPMGWSMATAAGGNGVLFSGGYEFPINVGSTYVWSPSGYSALPGTGAPALRRRSVSWFDPLRQITVVTNVASGDRSTWYWNGTAWSQPERGRQLPEASYALAYDSWSGRLLTFGGAAIMENERRDLWELRSNNAAMVAAGGPLRRMQHASAFDSVRGRFVVFGGCRFDNGGGSYQPLGDGATHEWDGSQWHSVPSTTWSGPIDPRFRIGAAMAFDRARGRTVLFGGAPITSSTYSPVYRNDTYEWDGSTWTHMPTATLPPAAAGRLIYHDGLGQCLLQVGSALWTWAGSNWNVSPIAAPPGVIAYDVSRDRLVAANYNSAHELDPATNVWVPIAALGVSGTGTFDLSQGAFAGSDGLGDYVLGVAGAARLRPFGVGCAGSAGEVVLHGEDAPRVGTTLPLHLARLPIGAPFVGMLGAEATTWNGQPLPIDLSSFGMPGCFLHTAIDAHELRSGTTWPVAIPNLGALLGLEYRLQAFVFDAAANALGATTSTAIAIRIGG